MEIRLNCACNGVDQHSPTCKIPGDRFTVKDGGGRELFASGMTREPDKDKVDYSRIMDGPMYDRWAVHLTKGAVKYPDVKPGIANWLLADSEIELTRAKKSAARHFRQWIRGDIDEDHAAAFFFNVNEVEYIKEKLARKEGHCTTGTCNNPAIRSCGNKCDTPF